MRRDGGKGLFVLIDFFSREVRRFKREFFCDVDMMVGFILKEFFCGFVK